MNLSTLVCRISLIFVLAASLATAQEERFFTTFSLSEHQLDIDRGGRVNAIAVHPIDARLMVVASETGGLFKTTFEGSQPWKHVRFADMPAMFTQSVVYLPWNPNIMLATAKADFKETNGGGLWRSLNGGQSWHRISLTQHIPNFNGRLSAYGISVVDGNQKIVIGTSEGIFWSTDPAAVAWNYSNVFPSGDKTVYSVFVENGNPSRIYAGGPSGVRFTDLPTISWQQPAAPPNVPGDPTAAAVLDIHAFARTPAGAAPHQQLFVVNRRAQLFRSGDRGVTWTRITTLPGGDGCGGTAFIRVGLRDINATKTLELFFGNRCKLRRREVRVVNEIANYEERPWVDAQHDGNPRDLALFRSDPVLMGSNFGLHKPTRTDGLIWNLAGNGLTGGYNALQIAEVDGQRVQKDGKRITDLYIATQDNNLWSLSEGVIHEPFIGSACFIEGPRDPASLSEADFTFAPGPHPPRFAGRHLETVVDWPLPPGEAGKPAFVGHGDWVQQVRPGPFLAGLAIKEHFGAMWRQYAVYSAEPRDIPKLGRPGSLAVPRHPSIVYQAYRSRPLFRGGPRRNLLMRIMRDLDSNNNATVFYPAMEGFGSLGINPTMFAWYQVFGVEPNLGLKLIAPDIHGDASAEAELKRQVKMSANGGESWEVIQGLKELVSTKEDGTKLLFRTDLSGRGLGQDFPLVTAVSFCPDEPRLVLIGTSEGGIYASDNHGRVGSWRRIAGSDEARYVTSFFWEDANTVFVSTYGRGLWKLTSVRVAVPDIFDEELCLNCEILATDSSPDQPAFDGSVMAFGGSMLGVRTEDGQLREVFVQPGTSVIFTGDLGDPQDDIAITDTDGGDTSKYTELPKPPHDGWVLTGVVFTEGDMLTGAVYAESEISLVPPVGADDPKGSTVSPIDGQPYIRIVSSDFSGVATVAPGETFSVTGTDFLAGMRYEVLLDGEPLKGDVTADSTGAFTARIPAPAEHGGHRVEVRAVGSAEVLDGSEFVVR